MEGPVKHPAIRLRVDRPHYALKLGDRYLAEVGSDFTDDLDNAMISPDLRFLEACGRDFRSIPTLRDKMGGGEFVLHRLVTTTRGLVTGSAPFDPYSPEPGTWSRMGLHDIALAYAAHFEGESMGTFIRHKFGLRESAGWERLVKQHEAEVASAEAERDPDPDSVNDPLAEAVTRGFVAGLYAARWEAGRRNQRGELLLDAVDGDMTPVEKSGE